MGNKYQNLVIKNEQLKSYFFQLLGAIETTCELNPENTSIRHLSEFASELEELYKGDCLFIEEIEKNLIIE